METTTHVSRHRNIAEEESLVVRKQNIIKTTRVPNGRTRRSISPDFSNDESRNEDEQADNAQKSPSTFKEKEPDGWDHAVALVPHTEAPLACRISQTPHSSTLTGEVSNDVQLDNMSLEQQENAIMKDLLYNFMGYEGDLVHCAKLSNNMSDQDEGHLVGPDFNLPSKLTPSLRDLTATILKMATQYKGLERFIEFQSQAHFGVVSHALCASMSRHLRGYLTLVVQLEHQLITNTSFTMHQLHLHTISTGQVIAELHGLAREILSKTAALNENLGDAMDDYDNVDNIIEQLREGGDLLPGSMKKKTFQGSHLLRLLTERRDLMAGNPVAKDLLQSLLEDASRPYTSMLNEWLYHGSIKDPHGEFLVKEQQSIHHERLEEDYTDEYWDKRYTLRENEVPHQLESMKDKVLLAGKYLNVVRECGGVDIHEKMDNVPTSFEDSAFRDTIQQAYAKANSALIELLLNQHGLAARLRSMKHYFFLDRSDFFTYFLDLSASELHKPWRLVNTAKLQSLLDLVLRQPGTVAAQDAFKEDIKVHMSSISWTRLVSRILHVQGLEEGSIDLPGAADAAGKARQQIAGSSVSSNSAGDEDAKMNGFEALEFKFSVPFPLSLVISSKTVFRYQILFRYLLSLRHLEDQLVRSWQDHLKVLSWVHRSGDVQIEQWKRKAWTLRARMLIFIQHTTYYCTAEVIEPNWQRLRSRISEEQVRDQFGRVAPSKPARTVDELMEYHVDFLDTCLKECMLMNYKLLKIIGKLFTACKLFSTYTTSLSRTLFTLPVSSNHGSSSDSVEVSNSVYTTRNPLLLSEAHKAFLSQNYGSRPIPPEQTQSAHEHKLADMFDMLSKYEHNFEHHLRLLLDALDYYAATETVALGRLCAILGSAYSGSEERRI